MPTIDERPSPSRPLGRRYRLEQRLGRGGSGEVFRATDERLHRRVALKLFEIGDATPEEIRRYAHEARVLSSLAHPGLVALLDVGADTLPDVGPVAFLVMELVDGRTLRETIAAGPLTPRVTADVGRQLALALGHAHSAGVLHRDVKPSNVLVAPDRAPTGAVDAPALPVVLADFGIAVTDHHGQPDLARLDGDGRLPEPRAGAPGARRTCQRRLLPRPGPSRVPHGRARVPGRPAHQQPRPPAGPGRDPPAPRARLDPAPAGHDGARAGGPSGDRRRRRRAAGAARLTLSPGRGCRPAPRAACR